ALALKADPGPFLDAGRDLHRVALRPQLAPRAAAGRARLLDDRPVAAAAGTGLGGREKSLALCDHAPPVADRADDGCRPRLGPGAVAGMTRHLEAHRDLGLDTLQRILERQRHLHLDVVAALAPLLRAAAAHPPAEHAAENVAQVAEVPEVEPLGRVP